MKFNIVRVLLVAAVLIFSVVINQSTVYAADKNTIVISTTNKNSLEELDQALAVLEKKRQNLNYLKKRITNSKGFTKKAYEARLDKAWLEYLQQGLSFAENVAAEQESEVDISTYRKQAIDILKSQYEVGIAVIKRTRIRMDIPEPGLSAAEQAAAYTRIFDFLETINQVYEVLLQSFEMSKKFQVDISKQKVSVSCPECNQL